MVTIDRERLARPSGRTRETLRRLRDDVKRVA
jgi:hypothetical protein